MNSMLLGVALVLSLAYLVVSLAALFKGPGDEDRLRKRLASCSASSSLSLDACLDITKRQSMSELPFMDEILSRFQWTTALNRLLVQAGITTPLGVFVLLGLLLSASFFLLARLVVDSQLLALVASLPCCLIPLVWIRFKRNRRLAKFEAQLADGLELVARSLKAGHTFSSGLSMVVQEFSGPIKEEFSKTLDEINFGVNAQEALHNLSRRVLSTDLDFFVISVNIQSETGGNLAEIVESIALLIRERFKLKGRVKVLSAEGKLTAIILIALPIGVGLFVNLTNPEYLHSLITEPLGRIMAYGALGMMLTGVLVIRKMINIKV